ncbi:DUF4340 domain-containing protein [Akkermansiaceae bacterium]|nr:DUF4340 domain-containing protein [bacterium]MDA7907356.1 DUF4340 domain-containing protein [Akkermansiaceae bacterium]MDA7933810.1 DUF4340 domain-containing protein [Akkermansiaceae bacterium]MDB4464962.1 DUF4340 domain-containing protein [Akkermansiaceae bacterium]
MRILPTLFITLITAGLGFLAVMHQLHGNLYFIFGAPPLKAGGTLYQFDPADVGRINILNSDGTRAELVKAGGVWWIKEPWDDYADARAVRALVEFAAKLRIEDVIKREEVKDMADYGLKKSKIEVQMFDKSGGAVCHFKMGRYTSWRGFDPDFKSEDPTARPPSFPTLIINPAEEDQEDYLYVCSDIPDPRIREDKMRDYFAGGLKVFRDHRVFYNSPGFAGEITIKEKNSEITVKRDGLSKTDDWRITKPYELAGSPAAINKLLGGLAALQAGAVLDESALALPDPLPDNIDYTISISYYLPDGSLSTPVTAIFYPPENDQVTSIPVIVSEGPEKKRSAVLLVPNGPGTILDSIPRSVNTIRSRTMTSLQVRQVESIKISDFMGRAVDLTLEMNPHERARRWYARVFQKDPPSSQGPQYDGPANIFQINELFQALFKNEVKSFTNDASTDPTEYGLDQPIRKILINLKDAGPAIFVVGEKLRPQYFARRADNGRPLEISEEAYEAGLKGIKHRELEIVARPGNNLATQATGLELLGLDRPKVVQFEEVTIHLGKVNARHFFANRLDEKGYHSPHVVEIGADKIGQMPLEAYQWRGERLWNINRFEINGLSIEKKGEAALDLTYNFYASEWSATRSGKDVTALLNTNKAEKLLKKLTDIEVKKWIGPMVEDAANRLIEPDLQITVLVEEIDETGKPVGTVRRQLKISQIVEDQANRLLFGKTDTNPSYFLIDLPTVQRLSVQLLEE